MGVTLKVHPIKILRGLLFSITGILIRVTTKICYQFYKLFTKDVMNIKKEVDRMIDLIQDSYGNYLNSSKIVSREQNRLVLYHNKSFHEYLQIKGYLIKYRSLKNSYVRTNIDCSVYKYDIDRNNISNRVECYFYIATKSVRDMDNSKHEIPLYRLMNEFMIIPVVKLIRTSDIDKQLIIRALLRDNSPLLNEDQLRDKLSKEIHHDILERKNGTHYTCIEYEEPISLDL